MLIPLHIQNPNPRDLKKVIQILNQDGVVIVPTDTIYAMACRLDSKKAIEKMARVSGKKSEKVNFSLLCADLAHIADYTAFIEKSIFRMLKNNLPGPFTFILEANKQVSKWFSGNKKTIGIRVPDNIIVQQLVSNLGVPLVVTTIHHDDKVVQYMTDPEEIFEKFQYKVDAVIDAGAGGNEPSTVVDCTQDEPLIIRQGKGIL
jgi:tRNA threonylcarbamoyl adenosine modification protein (Sua5/YciO/YrdC/YwlC family)